MEEIQIQILELILPSYYVDLKLLRRYYLFFLGVLQTVVSTPVKIVDCQENSNSNRKARLVLGEK